MSQARQPKTIHPTITLERVMALVERRNTSLDNPGLCLACGEEADSVEPDARRYTCEICEERQVYGADEILLSGKYRRK